MRDIMKKYLQFLSYFFIGILCSTVFSQKNNFPYLNPNLSIEQRVQDLLSRMTLEEKFWQLFMIPGDLSDGKEKYKNGIFGLQIATKSADSDEAEQMLEYSKSGNAKQTATLIKEIQQYFVEETRLGIPIIPFDEALHGLIREGATAFPQAIGLAATWDVDLMENVSTAIAQEVKSRGIRQILSPVVNIARDVRWGRVEETYGEDPFLASQMGVAFVKSFEKMGIITTTKHFVANVGDGGRDSYPIHFDERLLREIYFPAFKACFQLGGAQSVMTAYNSLDGVPCSANQWLLQRILKDEWKFDGFVISDAGAVGGILDLHHTVANREKSAKVAFEGGLDVIFQTDYDHHIPLLKAVKDRMISEKVIDEAISRVLKAKFRLGLFENPYVEPDEAEKWNGHENHRQLALEAARKSIVLLKNENNILPLSKNIKKIAVIGTDAVEARLGGYSGPGVNKISILDGIKNKISNRTEVSFIEGCGRTNVELVPIPTDVIRTDDNKSGLKGEYFNNIDCNGEPVLTRIDPQINFKWTLFPPHSSLNSDWFSVRWTGKLKSPVSGTYQIGVEGSDGFRLFINDQLVLNHWQKQSNRTASIPFEFVKNIEYDICLEFYENFANSTIRLVWNVGVPNLTKKINEAVEFAKKSDVVIVVTGINEGEFQDRANLSLPGRQEEMIQKLTATGKPLIVVLIGGSAITMSNWLNEVSAIIEAWYPGEVGGSAVADILFGDYNPGGKLPITFPKSVAQLPLYYNHKPTGRGDDYLDMSGKPLFPFGHGLSYTRFEYSDLEIIPNKISVNGKAKVKFRVKNTGDRSGEEVVQLYIRDLVASVTRTVMELKGFKRINVKSGGTKEVVLELTSEHLSLLNEKLEQVIEPGDFKIMIGSSSKDLRLRGFLKVVE